MYAPHSDPSVPQSTTMHRSTQGLPVVMRRRTQTEVILDAGETLPVLTAGPEGCALLVLQFARASDRPGANPQELAKRNPAGYVERAKH